MQAIDGSAVVLFAPEQQAFLTALAEAGTDKRALEAAGIDRRLLRAWKRESAFAEALADANASFTESTVGSVGRRRLRASGRWRAGRALHIGVDEEFQTAYRLEQKGSTQRNPTFADVGQLAVKERERPKLIS